MWLKNGNTFSLVGKTEQFETLTPNYYQVHLNAFTGLAEFIPIAHKEETLFKLNSKGEQTILSDLDNFWQMKEKYQEFGLAHKRGLLMYGPPGCGKSSILGQIIDYCINNNIVVLNFNTKLRAAISTIRQASDQRILIIGEDLDAIVDNHGEESILELLDGNSSYTNIAYIFSTNYIEEIPTRISKRPGRIDKAIEISYPDAETKRLYLKNVFGNKLTSVLLETIIQGSEGFSFAHVKETALRVLVFADTGIDAILTEMQSCVACLKESEKE